MTAKEDKGEKNENFTGLHRQTQQLKLQRK